MNQLSNLLSLALYGGSFDPVHCAHLEVARAVLQQAEVDKVVFIPAARSPLKANHAIASDADRAEMLRIATRGEDRYDVDLCEIERGGVSYTVDTLEFIRGRHRAARLYWIIGADQVELLPRWHRIETLASQVEFLVLGRPGYSLARPAIPGLSCLEINAPVMPQSSSEIRARLAKGGEVSDWLPDGVEAFISSRGLYTPKFPEIL